MEGLIFRVLLFYGGFKIKGFITAPMATRRAADLPFSAWREVVHTSSAGRLQGAGCRVQGAGCRVQGAGLRSDLARGGVHILRLADGRVDEREVPASAFAV